MLDYYYYYYYHHHHHHYHHHHYYYYYYAQATASQVWRAARSREDRGNKVNEKSIDEIDDLRRRLITKPRVAAAIPPKIDRCLIVVDLYSFIFFASSLFPARYISPSCPPSPRYTQLSHFPEERKTRAASPSSIRPTRRISQSRESSTTTPKPAAVTLLRLILDTGSDIRRERSNADKPRSKQPRLLINASLRETFRATTTTTNRAKRDFEARKNEVARRSDFPRGRSTHRKTAAGHRVYGTLRSSHRA